MRRDGLDRLAFENNDLINHIDPSGHWSLPAIFGVAIGTAFVLTAAAITVFSGGLTVPLAAGAGTGALSARGIAGMTYSLCHRNEREGKFWGWYAAMVLVNAAIGGASGALREVVLPAKMVSATGRLEQAVGWSITTAMENMIGAAASVATQVLIKATPSIVRTVAHNAFENKFYGTYRDLFGGVGQAFVSDAIYGTFSGGVPTARCLFKGPPELKSN